MSLHYLQALQLQRRWNGSEWDLLFNRLKLEQGGSTAGDDGMLESGKDAGHLVQIYLLKLTGEAQLSFPSEPSSLYGLNSSLSYYYLVPYMSYLDNHACP